MDDETLVDVHFKWSDKYGECFDCGLPAAFVSPIRFGEKDLTSQANRLCAVCAANEAAFGMPIQRLDEVFKGTSMKFEFTVTVETDTLEHAKQVIVERTCYDEQYEDDEGVAFEYSIDLEAEQPQVTVEDNVKDEVAREAIRRVLHLLKGGHHTPHAPADAILNYLGAEL